MTGPMTKRQRIVAALAGEPVDRAPLTAWRGVMTGGSGQRLGEEVARFALGPLDLDLAVLPSELGHPIRTGGRLDPQAWSAADQDPWIAEHLKAVTTFQRVDPNTPLVVAMGSATTEAIRILGDDRALLAHAERLGDELQAGLEVLTEAAIRLVDVLMAAGVDGMMLVMEGAGEMTMDEKRYRALAEEHDHRLLEAIGSGIAIAHLPARNPHLAMATDYPVTALSWADRTLGPSLAEVRQLTGMTLMGGLDQLSSLATGPSDKAQAEARDAWTALEGRGLILAPGGELSPLTPDTHLVAVREVVEELTG